MTTTMYPAFGPVHRLASAVLRDWFARVDAEVHIGTLIPQDFSNKMPFLLVRSDRRAGLEVGITRDDRFVRSLPLSIEVFTNGVNAESDGYDLAESCRLALYAAWRDQKSVPGCGSISTVSRTSEPARVSDYATSTGVVQYASLPKGAVRHEITFQLLIRPPEQADNRYLPH